MTSDRHFERTASPVSRYVNFLIAGVQKAGTSSLFELLRQHPAIGLSSVKEVHFFDDETINWSKPPYERYHSFFPRRRRALAYGEATPIYSYWPNALERIKAYRPDMKLVLLFRDPISRAYSAWSHQRRKGRETLSFAEAIRQVRHRNARGSAYVDRHFSYVERGFYAKQLARCLELFPRGNVLALDYSQLSTDPSGLMQQVTSFLGVPGLARPPHAIQANASPQAQQDEPPSSADIEILAGLFAPDLNRFAQMINFSIAHWPTVQLMHGQLSADEVANRFALPSVSPYKQNHVKPTLHPVVTGAAILSKRAAAIIRRFARRAMS